MKFEKGTEIPPKKVDLPTGGERMTLADIMLFAFLEFAATVGQSLYSANTNIAGVIQRMRAWPAAQHRC